MRTPIMALSLLACACAPSLSQVRRPCTIEGVTIHVLDWQKTDGYCKAVLLAPVDPGQEPAFKEAGYAEGCFRGKEIVVPAKWRVIIHEVAHLLKTQCGEKTK